MAENLRVLVIDDSQHIRDFLIEYVLEPNGFEVDYAVNGAEGLRKALHDPPDLILMDYEMPLMTGREVMRELHNKGNKVPVILMTASGSEELAIEVFRLGASNYVMKPFQPDEMLDAMEGALAVARLIRERDAIMQQLLQANKQLEKRVGELKIIYQVGKSITALIDPQTTLERLVEAVLFVSQGEQCTLNLIDPDTGRTIKQVTKEQPHQRDPALEREMSVPLQIGQKVVGALIVAKKVTGQFTKHDHHLLRMLADYAAIAIHNLQLMYQIQHRKEKEKKQIRDLFERYVTPTLVEQMLNKPHLVRLGGTRETVAIMFADVRGFSNFSNSISPELLIELLNQYMRVAADAVLDEEGTLDKFMGDAVMAFFNAPLPQEDYPMRAIRSAWYLQRAVSEVHAHLPKEYHLKFGIGVGVGEAVVGNIGAPKMMNFTVIGDAVNKVKRLQENAKGGQILIDKKTYDLVKKQVRVRPLGNIHLKGQKKSEPVYEVISMSELGDLNERPEFSTLPNLIDDFGEWSDLSSYSAKV